METQRSEFRIVWSTYLRPTAAFLRSDNQSSSNVTAMAMPQRIIEPGRSAPIRSFRHRRLGRERGARTKVRQILSTANMDARQSTTVELGIWRLVVGDK